MQPFALIALVSFVFAQQYTLNLDCSQFPGPCNNDCYAVYVGGKSRTLNWNKDSMSGSRRSAAGCVSPSPCTNGRMATPNPDETSCDEYPYASVVEGGSGAILRCTDLDENTAEGSDLSSFLTADIGCGNQPCTFTVGFSNPGTGLTPYCLDLGGANDGFEYTYAGGGVYNPARRDSNGTEADEGGWALHQPDPAHFIPPHHRREVLLEDGTRMILPTRNFSAPYDDTIFLSKHNGTVVKLRAVKELVGDEKTWELQDPALRKAKRAVEFAS